MHLFSLLGGKRKRKERASNGRRCHLIYPQDLRVPIITGLKSFRHRVAPFASCSSANPIMPGLCKGSSHLDWARVCTPCHCRAK